MVWCIPISALIGNGGSGSGGGAAACEEPCAYTQAAARADMGSFSDGEWRGRGPAPPGARAVSRACLRKRHAPSHAPAIWGAARSA